MGSAWDSHGKISISVERLWKINGEVMRKYMGASLETDLCDPAFWGLNMWKT